MVLSSYAVLLYMYSEYSSPAQRGGVWEQSTACSDTDGMLHHWQTTIKSLQFCRMGQYIGDNVVKGPGDWWQVKGSDYSGPLDKDETEKQETTMGKVGWRPRERGLKWRPWMLSLLGARWQHEIGTILKMLGQDSNLHPQQSKMGCGGKTIHRCWNIGNGKNLCNTETQKQTHMDWMLMPSTPMCVFVCTEQSITELTIAIM